MEDDYGSNVHAAFDKSVRFMECPLWRGFVIRDSLGIRPRQNIFVRLREVSALEDVRFREVPLYYVNLLMPFYAAFSVNFNAVPVHMQY